MEEGIAGEGRLYGADATLGYASDTHGNFVSLIMPRLWISGGVRKIEGDDSVLMPYVEGGTWLLLSFGAGWMRVNGGETERSGRYFFLGAPIPFWVSDNEGHLLVLEPYLRHHRIDGVKFNEFGVLLKYCVGFFSADWL